jgi:hypothetical protein
MLHLEAAAPLAQPALAQDNDLIASAQGIDDDRPFFECQLHRMSWPGASLRPVSRFCPPHRWRLLFPGESPTAHRGFDGNYQVEKRRLHSPGRKCDKILVLHQDAPSTGHVNPKWTKRNSMQGFANLFDLHFWKSYRIVVERASSVISPLILRYSPSMTDSLLSQETDRLECANAGKSF